MIDISRELVAYGIIATIAVIVFPLGFYVVRQRQRQRLRRRGIKRYGH